MLICLLMKFYGTKKPLHLLEELYFPNNYYELLFVTQTTQGARLSVRGPQADSR